MEKKNGKGLIILVAIICCVICLVGGYSLGKGIFTKKEETNNNEANKNSDNKVNTEEEVELTDAYIKRDISKKASIILTRGKDYSGDDIIDILYYNDIIDFLDMTDDSKLATVLNYNYKSSKFRDLTYNDVENVLDNDFKEGFVNSYNSVNEFLKESKGYFMLVDSKTIENSYYELFGDKVVNHRDIGECPSYTYISNHNLYLSSMGCGDVTSISHIFYKESYTIKNNNIYVYVYTATYDDQTHKLYKGWYTNKNDYLYDVEFSYNEETHKLKCDNEVKTNYEKYAKYRLVFEKDSNGVYHYKSTEKLN